ncbi:MAG: prolipoprotein diacylglyceryl transferase family protein, partial [Chloroflexota bacterium]
MLHLVGGLAGGCLAAHFRGILSWRTVDTAVHGMLLGQAIGRIGCIV